MTATEEGASGNPLASATDRIRESARWLLTAFAAVGVILAGGLQLSGIGSLTIAYPGRLTAALLGLALCLGAVIFAIGQAGGIATKSYVTLPVLLEDENEPVRRELEKNPALLAPHETVADLDVEFRTTATDSWEKHQKYLDKKAEGLGEAQLKPFVDASNAAIQAAKRQARIRDGVLDVASYVRVKIAYERAVPKIAVAAVVAAVGTVGFAWGVNPPLPAGKAGGVLPKTPSNVTVIFESAPTGDVEVRVDDALDRLGPDCDRRSVSAVALEVAGETYTVVSVKTDRCSVALFDVDPAMGEVRARE